LCWENQKCSHPGSYLSLVLDSEDASQRSCLPSFCEVLKPAPNTTPEIQVSNGRSQGWAPLQWMATRFVNYGKTIWQSDKANWIIPLRFTRNGEMTESTCMNHDAAASGGEYPNQDDSGGRMGCSWRWRIVQVLGSWCLQVNWNQ